MSDAAGGKHKKLKYTEQVRKKIIFEMISDTVKHALATAAGGLYKLMPSQLNSWSR
jgi:hypothetical protein